MFSFHGGIKNLFNFKEPEENKKSQGDKREQDLNQDQAAKQLIETKEKITSHELAPVDTTDLKQAKQPQAAEIINTAAEDLSTVKKESLNNLDQVGKLSFTAGIVDTSDILRGRANRAASEKMTADKKDLVGFKGLLQKIWKYNLAEQYSHEQERVKAKKDILANDNIFSSDNLGAGEKEEASRKFKTAILGRFTTDIKGLIEENLGEKKETLNTGGAVETDIKADLKEIINDYADGKLDEASFEGEKRQIFEQIKRHSSQGIINKNGEMFIDNFLEIARQVKELKDNIRQAADHQEKLRKFDFDINLILGKAKEGIKTETHYNPAERTVEKLRRTKLGSMVNEVTLASAVGLVYSASTAAFKPLLRSKALAIGTLGLSAAVAGTYAGIKESQMQKRERQTLETRDVVDRGTITADREKLDQQIVNLEAVKNKTVDEKELKKIKKQLKQLNSERADIIDYEKSIYNKESASELSSGLAGSLYEIKSNGQRVEKDIQSEADAEEIIKKLANIEARLEISNEKGIDLISYSKISEVEGERRDLLITKCEARARLQKLAVKGKLSFDPEQRLRDLTALQRHSLLSEKGDIARKDAEFNKHKNKAIAKKVLQNMLVGLGAGLLAQEAFAFLSDKQEGLIENAFKGDARILGDRDTAAKALWDLATGHHNPGSLHEIALDHGTIKMPGNCDWVKNPDGSFNLLRGSEVIAGHLTVDPNGQLTEEAKHILAENHISFNDSQHFIETGQTLTKVIKSGPEDYITKHPKDFHQVSRGLWYSNDTPMYRGADGKSLGADLNELKLHWGGDHGSGIDVKNNAYVMSAVKMTPDGSFQTVNGTKLSEDATKLLKAGKLKMFFSLSNGTQNQVVEALVDPKTGAVSMDRGSELGKLLFSEENNQAVLNAKFAEVGTVSGVGNDGVEKIHVFATAVGKGLKDIAATEIIPVPPVVETVTNLDIPRDWDVPPFIPVGARTPLGKKKINENPEVGPSSYYGYSGDLKKDRKELKIYRNNPDGVNLENLKKTLGIVDSDTESSEDDETLNKRKPLFVTLDNDNYDTSVKLKSDNTKLKDYRDKGDKFVSLVAELKNNPKYKKYSFLVDQLKFYVNYDNLSQAKKIKVTEECKHYNKHRNGGAELSAEDYVGMQIGRLQNQIENTFLSEAQVGEKPFSPDFYKESPLIKGMDRAEEVVIILDDPIGDEVVTIPAVLAVERYLEENKFNKPIKLAVTKTGLKLFQCLVDQFPGKIELLELGHVDKINKKDSFKQLKDSFANDHKEKFIINAHKEFENYDLLNLSDDEAEDISRVMSVDWSSWVKEEIPKRRGLTEKYDTIPSRIMRNFETMFGQKLFADINKMDHFLEKENNYDQVSGQLKNKYKIENDENIIVISAGSGVMPKEYEPEKWEKVIREILKEHPKSKVLFIEDPNKQRQDRYNPMVQKLIEDTGRISLVKEPLENMNTIMSMADLVITPDTGLGHYAAALGKPDIMLILGDPVRWSSAKTERIIHKKARESYAKNKGTYDKAWTKDSGYYVNDNGEMIGASNLSPELITKAADKYLKK